MPKTRNRDRAYVRPVPQPILPCGQRQDGYLSGALWLKVLCRLCIFWAVLAGTLFLPGRTQAAPTADQHTVIYYLIEMHRQYTRTCDGIPMGQPPSLMPSESLETLAGEIGIGDQPLSTILERRGLADSPVFQGTASGETAQAVFDDLLDRECPALMGPAFRYVGAARHNGKWTVVLAEREPVFELYPEMAEPLPSPEPQPGVIPLLEEETASLLNRQAGQTANIFHGPEPGTGGFGVPEPLPDQEFSPEAIPEDELFSVPGHAGEMIRLVNRYRAHGYVCGSETMPPAPPLRPNEILMRSAQAHAENMAAAGYFSSTSPAGVSLGDRLTGAGYVWSSVAETLAAVSPPVEMAVDTWLTRESQCRMLLSGDYQEAGVGYEPAKKFWVMTLGQPMVLEEGAIRLE